jgi:SIR2-like domain
MSLANEIATFISESPSPILFAGAGTAVRAGLPIWSEYLTHLAEHARPYDSLTANLMREMISEGDYLKAASYYFMTGKLRDVDRLKSLAKPLSNPQHRELDCLGYLPFKAYVTTNYDRSLLDLYAYVHHKSPISFDLGDPALDSAAFSEEFFIARLHGKVENPSGMILSESHYSTLASSAGYLSTLRNIFAYKQVLFLGFSFYDPAIRKVLDLVNSEMGPLTQGRHLAVLPHGVSNDFITRLNRLNIRLIQYDQADNHKALWDAICSAKEVLGGKESVAPSAQIPEPMALAKKYLAACYARVQMRDRLSPLREIIAEGLIGQLLISSRETGMTKDLLKERIAEELHIADSNSEDIVEQSLKRLIKDNLCERRKTDKNAVYRWTGKNDSDGVDGAIEILVSGTIDRYVVREQGHDTSDIRSVLRKFYHLLVLRRGWDLGAAFAARRPPDLVEVDKILWPLANTLAPKIVDGLVGVINDLLKAPSPEQTKVLADLGRTSFALELAIQAPKDTFLHKATLPQKIYLDASVLLPAITIGHPFNIIYKESIKRLVAAADRASIEVVIIAIDGFLNEVVNHRRLAKEGIEELGEGADVHLKRQASIYGSANMNVFLGAYVNLKAREPDLTFPIYLQKYASYENESQLARFLSDEGIKVVTSFRYKAQETIFSTVYTRLEIAFADELARGKRNPITLSHDAVQLSALDEDRKNSIKSIFVTADRTLREKIGENQFASLANHMVSHIGLAQLIDLLIGASPEGSTGLFGRFIWSPKISSGLEVARNYLIDIALNKYDEALAMNMGAVVDRVAEMMQKKALDQNINLSQPAEKDKIRLGKLVEDFEEDFFSGMREVIERRRKESE